MAELLELTPQLAEIVDLAIVDDAKALVGASHRLGAARAVDDRQASMAERQTGLEVETAAIRPAMAHGLGHALDSLASHGPVASKVQDACETAHDRVRP
jgi:hypothetical protein